MWTPQPVRATRNTEAAIVELNVVFAAGIPSRRLTGLRLSCGADLNVSQIEDYHSKTAPPASGAC